MLYATTKERFRRELDGVHYEIQATDPTEMDLEVLRDRAHWYVNEVIDAFIKIYYELLIVLSVTIWILEADDGIKLLAATDVNSSLLECIVWAYDFMDQGVLNTRILCY